MKYSIYGILIFTLIFVSCTKDVPSDFNNPESTWTPNFSFPLGYTSLAMNEESGFNAVLFLTNPATGYPFWVEEIDIPLSYTIPFDMQQLSDYSETITQLMIRVNTYNGFPAAVIGQVYFLTDNDQVIDSVFVNGPLNIAAGELNNDGQTVTSVHEQNDVFIDQDKINRINMARYVLVEGVVQNFSLDTTLIDYYPQYKLDIQIGVQVGLNLNIQ